MTVGNRSATLDGRVAVVTGAGRGIGRGISVSLARAGAAVVAVDLPDSPDVNETVARCRDAGVHAEAASADVSQLDAVEAVFDRVRDRIGPVDIAVSNAAYSDRHLMLDQSLEEFRRTIEVCMFGAYHTVRTAASHMRGASESDPDRDRSIVVIGSPHAHIPIPGALAYNMAKAGCDQLAKTAACELAMHGIRVNTLHPGWIDTPGERKFFSEDALAEHGAKIPMGRLGTPEDIGRGVVYLCDPASRYVTGSTLTIDGGIQLPYDQMERRLKDV